MVLIQKVPVSALFRVLFRSKATKMLCFVALLLTCQSAFAQMQLENSYSSANFGRMIRLELSGYKYIMMDNVNKQFRLYNPDHSLYKTINVPQYTGYSCNTDINWVSEKLFNADNLIEYVAYYSGSNDKYEVINENGTVLNSVPGYGSGEIFIDANDNHKLLLHDNGSVYVYALPGGLPCVPACITVGSKTIFAQTAFLSEPVPNPGDQQVRIQYVLPSAEKQGTISIYNALGRLMAGYTIEGSAKEIAIDTRTFPPGTYYYNLSAGQYFSEFKKLVIIK